MIEVMFVRNGARRWRGVSLVGLAVYALFLLVTPFEHHDLSCELKTPQHCTACAQTLIGTQADSSPTSAGSQSVDAGDAMTLRPLFTTLLLDLRTRGRSPPAA